MKNVYFLAIGICLLASCKDKNEMTLNGHIKGSTTGKLEILYRLGDSSKTDTVKLEGGRFTYHLKIKEPIQMAVRSLGAEGQELAFFADPGADITLTAKKDSMSEGKVDGGATQVLFKQVETGITNIMKSGDGLRMAYMQAQSQHDTAGMQQVQMAAMQLEDSIKHFAIGFAKKNTNSVISPLLALTYLRRPGSEQEMKGLYNSLSEPIKKSFFGKKMAEMVKTVDDMAKAAAATNIGSMAPDFTLPDISGKPISLSSYKGKYVLIDFWASWCKPCRQENPNVVKAYNAYKDKGFDIIGVSLDQKNEDWQKGVAEDKLAWTQVIGFDKGESEVAKKYSITTIPANFLLDKEGKIIAKDLRGEALESKLKEILQMK